LLPNLPASFRKRGTAPSSVTVTNRLPYNAAFANAISAHSIELDDTDALAYFHTAPPIVSSALAAAEWVNATGKDFLVGVTIGSDFVNRISRTTNPSLRERGFHTTRRVGFWRAGLRLDAL